MGSWNNLHQSFCHLRATAWVITAIFAFSLPLFAENHTEPKSTVIRYLTAPLDVPFDSYLTGEQVEAHPHFSEVLVQGETAVPYLIGALRNENLSFARISLIDFALLAIVTGESPVKFTALPSTFNP